MFLRIKMSFLLAHCDGDRLQQRNVRFVASRKPTRTPIIPDTPEHPSTNNIKSKADFTKRLDAGDHTTHK